MTKMTKMDKRGNRKYEYMTIKEIESVIKNLQTKKSMCLFGFTGQGHLMSFKKEGIVD